MAGPVDMLTVTENRLEPVRGWQPIPQAPSTEFRVLSVVRRILGTTLQVILLSFRVFCLRETMLK